MKDKRQEIVDAGKYLLKNGLVARTWGNISSRIDADYFYISPSGKDYNETLVEDIAKVKIIDCSYDENGPKPSSEKLIHAATYALRDDVNYIVHTHQTYASAICAEGYSVELDDGTFVPCAKYGLPGTKTLKKNVWDKLKKYPNANIFMMEKHGVIIFGSTLKEALDRASHLEKECKKIFDRRVKEVKVLEKMPAYLDDYAQMVPGKTDDKEALQMVKNKNACAMAYAVNGKPLDLIDRTIQNIVYKTKYSKLRDKK